MPVAETSIDAYREHKASGKLSAQHIAILTWFKNNRGSWTRSEISKHTGIRLSSICARVAELIRMEKLDEGARRRCTVTTVGAKTLALKSTEPAQLSLLEAA